MTPSLLKTIRPERLAELLQDDNWCLQQKFDGVRCIIQCRYGKVSATGRTGRPVDLGFVGTLLPTDEDYTLDGELAWGCFYAFDEVSESSWRLPYSKRLALVAEKVDRWNQERIRRPVTYATTEGKVAAVERAKAQRVEGVVLKRLDATWWSGVDETRGVRFKFVHRAEVVVSTVGADGKQSAMVGLYDTETDGALVCVGRVPLSGVKAWTAVNEALKNLPHEPVIEVEYLYATEAHQLYHPAFVRVRYDKSPTPADCPLAQLVGTYKGELDGGPSATTYPPPEPVAKPEKAQKPAGRGRPPWAKNSLRGEKAVLWAILTGILCAIGLFLRISRGLPTYSMPKVGVRGTGRTGAKPTADDE